MKQLHRPLSPLQAVKVESLFRLIVPSTQRLRSTYLLSFAIAALFFRSTTPVFFFVLRSERVTLRKSMNIHQVI